MWRGSVTHVPSGEKRYFDAFAHLVEHMESLPRDDGCTRRTECGHSPCAGRRRKRGGLTQGTNSLIGVPVPPLAMDVLVRDLFGLNEIVDSVRRIADASYTNLSRSLCRGNS